MRYSESYFNYNRLSRQFTTFTSDIAGRAPHPFGQIYNDAADMGLKLVLENGDELTFYVDSVDQCEGDIRAWSCSMTSETLRKFPQYAGTTVTVFND